jgi:O-antigen/teichoic acid export membrane protein
VSRRERTLRAALLSWLQTLAALAAGFWVTRLMVDRLGETPYALYVGVSTLLGWASLADLGLLATVPWLVAESTADKVRLGRMVGASAWGMAGGTVLYAGLGLWLWLRGPELLELPPPQAAAARDALAVGLALGLLGFPLRLAGAVLAGLQDVSFVGGAAILQVLGTSALTAALLLAGQGLPGAVLGLALPPLAVGLASAVRLRTVARTEGLTPLRPGREEFLSLARSAAAAAFSTTGWQLTTGAQALALSRAGNLEAVAQLAITSRLPLMLMQQAWTLPDAALVGLAQLKGEGLRARAKSVVGTLLQFQALMAVGVTAFVLALNPAFVRAWVGPLRYGGDAMNAGIALHVAVQCAVHALVTPAAVLGNRLSVGVATLLGGVAVLAASLVAGPRGATAVLLATAGCALLTTVPAGAAMLRAAFEGLPSSGQGRAWGMHAAWRFAAVLGLAWPVQRALSERRDVPALLLAGAACGVAFLLLTRSLWEGMPLSERQRGLLRRMRLVG